MRPAPFFRKLVERPGELRAVVGQDVLNGKRKHRFDQFGESGGVFTRCAFGADGHRQAGGVVDGNDQVSPHAIYVPHNGVEGNATAGDGGAPDGAAKSLFYLACECFEPAVAGDIRRSDAQSIRLVGDDASEGASAWAFHPVFRAPLSQMHAQGFSGDIGKLAAQLSHLLNQGARIIAPPHAKRLGSAIGERRHAALLIRLAPRIQRAATDLKGRHSCVNVVFAPYFEGAEFDFGRLAHVCLLHSQRSNMIHPAHAEADTLNQHVGFPFSDSQKSRMFLALCTGHV